MDIRLYNRTDKKSSYLEDASGHVLAESSLEHTPAEGIEVIANKVVKFLLTIKGSDILNPDYGCYLASAQIGYSSDLSLFKMELTNSVSRCAAFIKRTEPKDAALKLRSLQIQKIQYDSKRSPGRVDVFLKIITSSGHEAVLDIPITEG